MEKEYKLEDGGFYQASSPQEFVTRLRESSKFNSHLTDDEYMKAFAERFKIQTGKDVPIDTPECFMAALLEFKYVMII